MGNAIAKYHNVPLQVKIKPDIAKVQILSVEAKHCGLTHYSVCTIFLCYITLNL
jgi:hypothetical protein